MTNDEHQLLTKGLFDFRAPQGRDLDARLEPFRSWVDATSKAGLFQFLRHHSLTPSNECVVVDWAGTRHAGINLASTDYLGLSRHPAVVQAAIDAAKQLGTQCTGSEPMGGGFAAAKALERELAEFLRREEVVLFPTGWAAGYGAIKALIRPYDMVVMDELAHDCLQHGARASTADVKTFEHNDMASLRALLAREREAAPDKAILVVTESMFSMDSDHPNFRELVAACREHQAFVLVDTAHDLGVFGRDGRGVLEEQGVLDDIDYLVGSFSKCLASNGGFFASRKRAAGYAVRGFSGSYTFSTYLTAPQVEAARAALRVVRSEEGQRLRSTVLRRAERLREALVARGETVYGRPSPIVLVAVGREGIARLAYRACLTRGLVLNNIEFPACRRGQARFRLQLTPDRDDGLLERAVEILTAVLAEVRAGT